MRIITARRGSVASGGSSPADDSFEDFETGTNRLVSAANSGFASGGGSNVLWNNYSAEGAAATVSMQAGQGRFGGYGMRYRMTAGNAYMDMPPVDNSFWYFLHEQMSGGALWTEGKYNRMSFWAKTPSNYPQTTDPNRQGVEFGTYVRKKYQAGVDVLNDWRVDPENGGWHFYHFYTPRIDVWTKYIVDEHPQHSRESAGGHPVGNPGAMNGVGGNIWPTTTTGWKYGGDSFTRAYYNNWRTAPSSFPCDIYFDDFRLYTESDIGDVDHIASLEGSYNSSTHELHLGWCRNPDEDPTFTVKYHSADMNVVGFAAGTTLGTVGADGEGTYPVKQVNGTVDLTGWPGVYLAAQRSGQSVFRQMYLELT